jgi:shikimate kinase
LNRWLKDNRERKFSRMNDQLIVITGFMASGKTTVGRALATSLDREFIDLDELIASQQKKSIKEIIESEGEGRFRRIEAATLGQVLRKRGTLVIALGGGTWAMSENREMLTKRAAFTVWLDASFGLCWQRIEAAAESRPLATAREQAHQLYLERCPVYKLAQKRIACEGKGAAEIAQEVAAACLFLEQ